MTPFWVEIDQHRRVAIVPRPRGGDWLEDELRGIKVAGVDVLVSMLHVDEAMELGLAAEPSLAAAAGLIFQAFPVTDRETPDSMLGVSRFIIQLRAELDSGNTVATHCRASIGRSSMMLACLLVDEGWTVTRAFEALSAARGLHVPDTAEQVRWVESYAAYRRISG